jgi:hypothetical protein
VVVNAAVTQTIGLVITLMNLSGAPVTDMNRIRPFPYSPENLRLGEGAELIVGLGAAGIAGIPRAGGEVAAEMGARAIPELAIGAEAAAEGASVTELLEEHLQLALNRFAREGFTKGQAAAIRTNPKLAAAYKGERIDTFIKESVRQDARLQHLEITPRFRFGPDFWDPHTGEWFDVTTQAQWGKHTQTYGPFGTGIFH